MRDAVLSSFLDSGNQAWSSKTLREIIQVCTGGIWGSDPGSDEVDILVYRQTEFDDEGRLACGSGVKRSASKRQLESRTLQPGDILLQKSAGTPSLPGRVVLVPTAIERDATCSNFLQLIRANTKYCESLFLFWVLWYRHRRGLALEFQRGTNIRNLDLNRYLGKSVLLPSLAEQKRFVKTVSLIDDFIRKSEQALVESLHLSAVLRNFSLEVRDVH
jgi:type I restriction enzyme S subunit